MNQEGNVTIVELAKKDAYQREIGSKHPCPFSTPVSILIQSILGVVVYKGNESDVLVSEPFLM
jgi:hypothetical protein